MQNFINIILFRKSNTQKTRRNEILQGYGQICEYKDRKIFWFVLIYFIGFINSKIQKMLQYRNFLQQSRARRGETSFPVHYENPEHHSNQNIKDFVSNPGYGEIFYGDNKNPQLSNAQLKQSLHGEKNRTQQLSKYVYELQEQNAMLKAKLNEFMRHQQEYNAAYNQPNQQYGSYPVMGDGQEHISPASVAPPQRYASEPVYVQGPKIQQIPQPGYRVEIQPPNYNQGQSGYFATTGPSTSLRSLAQQKLNQIKDDDEQLRQYTIKLLTRPYY